jgi:hypothetical protein
MNIMPSATRTAPPPGFTRDPARSIGRAAAAHGRSRIDKSLSPVEHLLREWPWDSDAQLVLRAATAPIDTSNAAALMQIKLAILPMLVPFSAGAQLFDCALSLTLGADTGAFIIPGMTYTTGAGWVADGMPKPVIQGLTSGARIDPRKIAGITVVSSELYAQESIDVVLQTLLAESAGQALDAVLFSNQAGNAAHPPGLLAGIAPLTPSTGGTGTNKTDAFLDDIVVLASAVAPVSGSGKVAIIGNLAQILSAAYRVFRESDKVIALPSSALPPGTVIAVACNAVVGAMGVPEFETSTQATLHMSDAPTAIAGSGTTLASPVSSLFQTASIGTKMHLPASWALRDPRGAAWMQNVTW